MNSSPRLTRRALKRLDLEAIHVARNLTKADVHRFEWPPESGQFAVVKDMRARPLWFRVVLGRAALGREWKALRALESVEGVPQPLARLDADAFVMEWRAGTPAMNFGSEVENGFVDENAVDEGGISPETVERVARMLESAHARGVTHGDLHRNNILIAPDGSVTLIDWATACVFGFQPRGLKAWTFREWRSLDVRALAKFKARHAPHLVTPAERELLLHGSPLYRFVRGWAQRIRRVCGFSVGRPPEKVAARYERWLARAEQPSETSTKAP